MNRKLAIPEAARAPSLDPQQARLLEVLTRRAGEPVTYAELQAAGIELPASVISELELAGVEIERCHTVGRAGRRVMAVRLPAVAQPIEDSAVAKRIEHSAVAKRIEELVPTRSRRRPSPRVLAPLAVLVAAAAIVAVVLAGISGGSARRAPTAPRAARGLASSHTATRSRTHAARVRSHATRARSAKPVSRAGSARSVTSSSNATSPAPAAPAPVSNTSSGRSDPEAAVRGFYEAAANHQYAAAWALADPNMRGEVGGYDAFAYEMNSVRAISFQELSTVQSAPNAATVAVRTTSVQSSQTQQCSGTVRTVQEAGTWLLDGISINCS